MKNSNNTVYTSQTSLFDHLQVIKEQEQAIKLANKQKSKLLHWEEKEKEGLSLKDFHKRPETLPNLNLENIKNIEMPIVTP
jgi:hypothetical protein